MWKTGDLSLDILRAVGLCVALATWMDATIELCDAGIYWIIRSPHTRPNRPSSTLLNELLTLPPVHQLETWIWSSEPSITLGTMDGLLAATYTIPGARVISLYELTMRRERKPQLITDCLAKVEQLIQRLMKHVQKMETRAGNWLCDALNDYQLCSATFPQLVLNRSEHTSIPMTFTAQYSFSVRQPLSDGLVAERNNISLQGETFGILFAFLGAARVLRAQRVSHNIVNLYVRWPQVIHVAPDMSLPLLSTHDVTTDHALLVHWLSSHTSLQSSVRGWQGIAYQRLQTQAGLQSICLDCGVLTYDWLRNVEQNGGETLARTWHNVLVQGGTIWDRDLLILMLCSRDGGRWLDHLRDISCVALLVTNNMHIMYTLREIYRVTMMLPTSSQTNALRTVLDREAGTLRIGRSLRLLGRSNRAVLREIIDRLDTVRDANVLLRILADGIQACALATARTEFMIVPNEEDVAYLLDDLAQFGVTTIATLLIILAAVRYPKQDESPDEAPVIDDQQEVSSHAS